MAGTLELQRDATVSFITTCIRKNPLWYAFKSTWDKQHTVYFREGKLIEGVREGTTTLLEWFKMNDPESGTYDPAASTILYPDFPSEYTWRKQFPKRWQRRKATTSRGNVRKQSYPTIGRMYCAHPTEGER